MKETKIQLKLGKRAENKLKKAIKCWQCGKSFILNDEIKVRGDCQLTGNYRAAYQSCNLNVKKKVSLHLVPFRFVISKKNFSRTYQNNNQ